LPCFTASAWSDLWAMVGIHSNDKVSMYHRSTEPSSGKSRSTKVRKHSLNKRTPLARFSSRSHVWSSRWISRVIASDLSKFKVLALQPPTLGHAFSTATLSAPPTTALIYLLMGVRRTLKRGRPLRARASDMHNLVGLQRPDCWNVDPGPATTSREGV
jgi:hypothetical protein